MQAIIEGFGWGLFLAFLIGPIFFALIQAGIEYGFRAGFVLGLGIWISDVLYILGMFWSFNAIQKIAEADGFEKWVGLIGGIILLAFGLHSFFSKAPKIQYKGRLGIKKKNPYLALFSKGFLVNTVNPFTLLFWLGMMTNISVKPNYGNQEYWLFFGAIILTLVVSDSTKVFLAKQIRRQLREKHLLIVRKVTGLVLGIFGVALIIRTWII